MRQIRVLVGVFLLLEGDGWVLRFADCGMAEVCDHFFTGVSGLHWSHRDRIMSLSVFVVRLVVNIFKVVQAPSIVFLVLESEVYLGFVFEELRAGGYFGVNEHILVEGGLLLLFMLVGHYAADLPIDLVLLFHDLNHLVDCINFIVVHFADALRLSHLAVAGLASSWYELRQQLTRRLSYELPPFHLHLDSFLLIEAAVESSLV